MQWDARREAPQAASRNHAIPYLQRHPPSHPPRGEAQHGVREPRIITASAASRRALHTGRRPCLVGPAVQAHAFHQLDRATGYEPMIDGVPALEAAPRAWPWVWIPPGSRTSRPAPPGPLRVQVDGAALPL